LQQAADIADRLGDRRRWEQSIHTLATVKYLQGEFAPSAELFKELYTVAHRQGDVQYQAYGLIGQIRCRLTGSNDRRNDFRRVSADLEELHALLARNLGRVEEIMAHGVIALAYLRQGQTTLARQAAEKVMLLIGYSRPISYNLVHAYAAAPEVYLTLWEQSPLIADGHFVAGARYALESLRRFARIFPIGQPRAWLWQGKFEQLGGSLSEAEAAWDKSLAAAEKLGMPYEQGLTHLAFGHAKRATEDERQRHLAEALEIFTRLGAAYDAEQTRILMGEQP